MLSAAQISQFHRDGFVKGDRMVDDAWVAELRDEVLRVIADEGSAKPQPVSLSKWDTGGAVIYQICNIWEASDAFRRLITHAPIIDSAAELIGARELRVWHDQIQYKPANTGGVNRWHQDWPYWPILSGPTQVTAWIALDDAAEDNGCMSMVPGSHQWGSHIDFLHTINEIDDMPASRDGHQLVVKRCPVKAGEVHFHHGLTWHGSHANTSGRPRRAIAIHLMSEQTNFVASGSHLMKPYVESPDGAKITGAHFPQVWSADARAPHLASVPA
ncbi:MAG: phytanoyl-CoA dioxygenase family protein [Planctomycetes bacterium]|nr:phytanoyl-CoA dioxygenase family protein [Planctomycetota bacterium]